MLRINPNGTLTAPSIPNIYSGTTYSGLENMSDSFVLCATQPSDLQTPQINHSHPLITNPRGNTEPQPKPPKGGNGRDLDLESKFAFLSGKTLKTAVDGYKRVTRILNSVETLPHTVWIDIDGTLVNYRKKGNEPIIFQGRIIGLMQAFKDKEVNVGLFSYRDRNSIEIFLKSHPFIANLLSRDETGEYLIRSLEYINAQAISVTRSEEIQSSLNETERFFYNTIGGFGYLCHRNGSRTSRRLALKLLKEGEILIDDDPNHGDYDRLLENKGWRNTQFGISIRNSKKRIVRIRKRRLIDRSMYFSKDELLQLANTLRQKSEEWRQRKQTKSLFKRLLNLLSP